MTFTKRMAAVTAVGGVLGAAVALAAPASADPASGDYTATMLDAGASGKKVGSTTTWSLAPCGPDCIHVATAGNGFDVHRQGATWIGTDGPVTHLLDENTLAVTFQYPDGTPPVVVGLAKNP